MKITRLLFTSLLLISFSMLISYSFAQSCPSNMISYWKLQEASGPVYDDYYGNHNATAVSSAPSQAAGVSGKGQYFNASLSTFLHVADHSDFDWSGTNSFSIELWVKYTEIGSIRVFIGRDDPSNNLQWWIGQETTGHITWYLSDNDGGTNSYITTSSTYHTGQWVHIVAKRDGTTDVNSLIVNAGTPVTSTVDFNGNFASSAAINIGYLSVNSVPGYYYTGGLDEVAIYSRALDASEITNHYNNARLYQIGYCDGNEPVFLSTPNIHATVNQQYTYDADASGNPLPVYSLVTSPSGMTINSATGEIAWTPASATANGHVILRATNAAGTEEQDFNIYIAEQPDCRNNLIAYWDFDEAGTPYVDNIEGYELNGLSPASTTGIVEGALSFDGVNDSLNMEDPYTYPELIFFDFDDVPSFSFEVWMKSDATPSDVMVIIGRESTENQTQFWLGVNTDGSVGFYLRDYDGDNNYLEGGSVLDNNWHHIVATYNASSNSMMLYIDKINVDGTTQDFSNFGCSSDLNIGYLNTTLDKFWYEGLIDELCFYNTDLSSGTITENYNAAMTGNGACTYNYAPVITTTPETEVDEDSPYYYQIKATDIDDDVLSISAITKPAWLNFNYTPGDTSAVLSATPTNDNVGLHPVTLRVYDGSINVDQIFTIEVINVNDAPEITSTPLTIAFEDVNYTYVITATDDDDDPLTKQAIVKPAWLDFRNDSLTGTPGPGDVGYHNITLRVSDGTVNVDQIFQIEVRTTNDAPEFTSIPITTADDYEFYTYTYAAEDEDEDPLFFTIQEMPDWLTHNAETKTISGTPAWDDAAQVFDVSIRVSDGYLYDDQNFQITVGNENDPPVITSVPDETGTVGEEYFYQMIATDVDEDDELTYSLEYAPDWLTFYEVTHSLIGTPTEDDLGSNAIILKVSDGHEDVTQSYTITINLTAINDPENLIMMVFPNPAEEHVYFDFYSAGSVKIVLYDIAGNIQTEIVSENTKKVEVNVSDLPQGIYIYRVLYNDEMITGKFSKD